MQLSAPKEAHKFFRLIIRTTTVLFSLLFSFNGLPAQTNPPKLILSVVIDELDNDQLLLLQSSFSEKGINRLSREGFRFMSAVSSDFAGYPGTRMTSIYTGTTPSEHGIIGEQWFDHSNQKFTEEVSFYDKKSLTDAAKNNMSRTIGDHLKSFYGPKAGVAALTLNSPWLIHTLGYTPDYFYAFNSNEGQFFDVLKYNNDSWVDEFNSRHSINGFLSKQWGPVKDITSYIEYRYKSESEQSHFRSFFYDMNENGTFGRITGSPYGNTLLRDFTVAFLVNSNFGHDNIPDLLSICFTSRPFIDANGSILSAEKEDMLIRLDSEISSLVDFLDIEYGRDNYLIILTSASSCAPDKLTSGQEGVNTGYFEGWKTMSLLNLYLMAIHGQGKWVNGYNDGMIFLNRKLIEENNLSLKEMQEKAAMFMLEVSGVSKAVPTHDLVLGNHCDQMITKNLFPRRSCDIYIHLFPGWQSTTTELGSRQEGNSGYQTMPFIFFGWKTGKGAWQENVDAINMIPLLMKEIGLTHPKVAQIEEIPVFDKK